MTEYLIRHRLTCESCRSNFTKPNSIDVHFSVCGEQFIRLSYVNELGILQDVDGGLIKKGFHAGSCCESCGASIDEEVTDLALDEEVERLRKVKENNEVEKLISRLTGMKGLSDRSCESTDVSSEILQLCDDGVTSEVYQKCIDMLDSLTRENSENSENSAKMKSIEVQAESINADIKLLAMKLKDVANIIEDTASDGQRDDKWAMDEINNILFGDKEEAQKIFDRLLDKPCWGCLQPDNPCSLHEDQGTD